MFSGAHYFVKNKINSYDNNNNNIHRKRTKVVSVKTIISITAYTNLKRNKLMKPQIKKKKKK